MAAHPGPLRDLDLGDDAPADTRRQRDPLLRALPRPLSRYRRAGLRGRRRRARSLGRAGLLLARAQPPEGGARRDRATRRCAPRLRRGAPGAPGCRPVHGRGGGIDRLRPARAGRRRERGARARAPPRHPRGREDAPSPAPTLGRGRCARPRPAPGRPEPGADGTRRHRLHAEEPALPGVPPAAALLRPARRRSGVAPGQSSSRAAAPYRRRGGLGGAARTRAGGAATAAGPPRGALGAPGGALARGEDPEAALLRALTERVGLDVPRAQRLGAIDHAFTHRRLRLHVFRCDTPRGRVRLEGFDAHRWLAPAEVAELPQAALTRKALRLLAKAPHGMDRK